MTCNCPTCGHPLEALDLHLDDERKTVAFEGEVTELQPRQFMIFGLLLSAWPRLVTIDQMFDALYAEESDGRPTAKTVHVWVHHMRKRLDRLGLAIVSSGGNGYGLVVTTPNEAKALREGTMAQDQPRPKRALDPADTADVLRLFAAGHAVADIAELRRFSFRAVTTVIEEARTSERRRAEDAGIMAVRVPRRVVKASPVRAAGMESRGRA